MLPASKIRVSDEWPELRCTGIAIVLTALCWFSAQKGVGWILGLFSSETALKLIPGIFLWIFWPGFRQIVTSHLAGRWWALLLVALFCMWLAEATSWTPPIVQMVCATLVAMLIVWPVTWWALPKDRPAAYREPPKEQLRRYPLIRGIMRAVMAGTVDDANPERSSRLNRIALTGPWGCGKTFILDHVAFALQDRGLARAVKINPWACLTVAEARECLATGMRSLLEKDYPRSPPLIKVITKVLGVADAVEAVLESSGTASAERLSELNREFGKRERENGLRMVIVIDDMERAEPEVIKGLLPILNDLAELKHCTFLIALDSNHFERAFSEKGPAGTAGSGLEFLKKVIELAIPMPLASPRDRITAIARSAVGTPPEKDFPQPHLSKSFSIEENYEYPKLKAAIPLLEEYLPDNPRDLERFLHKARLFEVCFLADYSDEDAPCGFATTISNPTAVWAGFFHLWLMDVMYPGFADAVAKTGDTLVGYLDVIVGARDKKKQAADYCESLVKNGFSAPPGEEFSAKLIAFFNSPFSPRQNLLWASQGFLCPPHLPGELRKRLFKAWRESPKQLSLRDLSLKAFGTDEAPELVGAAGDLMKSISDSAGAVISGPVEAFEQKLSETEEFFRKVGNSFEDWCNNPADFSIIELHLNTDYLEGWVALHRAVETMNSAVSVELETLISRIACLLIGHIDIVKLRKPGDSPLFRFFEKYGERTKNLIRRMREEWAVRYRRFIIGSLRANTTAGFWPFASNHTFWPLWEPKLHFPKDSDEQAELMRLVQEPSLDIAESNRKLWLDMPENLRGNWRTADVPDIQECEDYWLLLWKAFEKNYPDEASKVRPQLLELREKCPLGLEQVLRHIGP